MPKLSIQQMIKKFKADYRKRSKQALKPSIAVRRKWNPERIAGLRFDPDRLQRSTTHYPEEWCDFYDECEGEYLKSGPEPLPSIGKRLFIIDLNGTIIYLN